jgi:hypothetical protein
MFRKKELELALLKGGKLKRHPLKAKAYLRTPEGSKGMSFSSIGINYGKRGS